MRFCWAQFTTLFQAAHIRFNASCPAVNAVGKKCIAKRVEPNTEKKKSKTLYVSGSAQIVCQTEARGSTPTK